MSAVASPVLASGVAFGKPADIVIAKDKVEFRNYVNSDFQERVQRTYLEQHTNQTYDYAVGKRKQYGSLSTGLELSIWEAAELLNDIIDESDPDVGIPQIHHCLQTAEAIRAAYPGEEWDWFHLTGFIHDLGKLLLLPRFGPEPQWATVGDTFPVGCHFDESIVFHETFKNNPDLHDTRYNTPNGVYEAGCGLENIVMSWGHDEYMYQVCKGNNSTLPLPALYMIRFHSFYPWHKHKAYQHLMNDQDKEMMKWVLEFNQFDLYSKVDKPINVAECREYYSKVAKKYFPEKVKF
jgi:inositol oxygenase